MTTRRLALILCVALISGCSGGATPFVPGGAGGANALTSATAGAAARMHPERRHIKTFVRIHIPRRTHKRPAAHPATLSPLTQSLSIAINTGAPIVFNTTPSSPGCTISSSGTTCTFAVSAPVGTDTFTVTTYSAVSAGGTALDRGVITVPISAGKANQVAITLGPVVTNTNDSGMGSLRYAVGSAGSGDTVMFLLPAGSTIALASPITIGGKVTIAGPGASSITISGGNTHQLFLITGTATISGLTLTQGVAAVPNQPGGAIYNVGSLTLANDVIGNSTSTVSLRRVHRAVRQFGAFAHRLHPHCTTTYSQGGALYNNGNVAISGTTFSNNTIISNIAGCIEAEGGAIYNDILGSLSSSGDTYSDNSAFMGGAVYNVSLANTSFTGDTFNGNTGCTALSGCPTSGCGATSCTSNAQGEGGAILDNSIGITIVNSTFSNNVAGGATPGAAGAGGAIYLGVSSGLQTISGDTFSGNVAGGGTSSCSAGLGGAIASADTTLNVEIDNDTFTNNSATGDDSSDGGAIAGAYGIIGTGDTFTGNTAVGSGGACTTSGTGAGGAAVTLGSSSISTFTNSTFANNSASGNYEGVGGAIYATGNLIVGASKFTSNTASANGSGGASSATGAGGALVDSQLLKVSGSTFTSNTSSAGSSVATESVGGAIAALNTLLSSGNTFTSNSATLTGATTTAAGGAVGNTTGTVVSNGDTFASNSVSSAGTAAGGGLFVQASFLVSNATFTSNAVSGPEAGGGAMIATGTGSKLTNVTMTGNSATMTGGGTIGAGGAFFDTGGATILNSSLTQNTATIAGGGIFSNSNAEVITNTSISGNTVTNASGSGLGGGGFYEGSGATIVGSTIGGNAVTIGGAGSSGGGGINDRNDVILENSTISGNKVLGTAPNSGGGGILTNSGVLAINSTVSNNNASENGGGIYNPSSGTDVLINATLFQNVASGNGGNVENAGTVTLYNSILGGGTAATGADLDNPGTANSGDYNILGTTIAGNAMGGTTTHNHIADPLLLALTNNGGPTFTNADQSGSPGRGLIPFSGGNCGSISLAADQRGFTRGAGGVCDVGAYEFAGVASSARHRPALKHLTMHFGRNPIPRRLQLHLHVVPIRILVP